VADTSIEWTDKVWNPTTGCDRVSPGCDNCYALTMAKRLKGMGSAKYQNDGDPRTSGPGFGITEHPDTLATPFSWREPRKVFVNSMSDLFHAGVSDEFVAEVFAVMALVQRHTFQVLTKRPGRLRSLLGSPNFVRRVRDMTEDSRAGRHLDWPLPNVWLGVSVEDQKRADLRIPALLDTPAAVRWLSCEPLLGSVDLDLPAADYIGGRRSVDWVVVGGESGPGARPMHPEWARLLREQCRAARVPFHFKQRGDWSWAEHSTFLRAPAGAPPRGFLGPDGEWRDYLPRVARLDRWAAMYRVGKGRAGRELDGRTWDEFPAVTRG
jgi:protein gp37